MDLATNVESKAINNSIFPIETKWQEPGMTIEKRRISISQKIVMTSRKKLHEL